MTTAPIPAEIELLLEQVARKRDGFRFFTQAPLETVAVLFEAPPAVIARTREYLKDPERREQLTEALLRARLATTRERRAATHTMPSAPRVLGPEEVIDELEGFPAGRNFLLKAPPETLAVLLEVPPTIIFKARALLERGGH